MKNILLIVSITGFLLVITAIIIPTSNEYVQAQGNDDDDRYMSDMARDIVDRLNQHRTAYEMPPLNYNELLNEAAKYYLEEHVTGERSCGYYDDPNIILNYLHKQKQARVEEGRVIIMVTCPFTPTARAHAAELLALPSSILDENGDPIPVIRGEGYTEIGATTYGNDIFRISVVLMSFSITQNATLTPSMSPPPSATVTPSATLTPSMTPTETPTPSPTGLSSLPTDQSGEAVSDSASAPSLTPSLSPTSSPTATLTPSPTSSPTETIPPTATHTPTNAPPTIPPTSTPGPTTDIKMNFIYPENDNSVFTISFDTDDQVRIYLHGLTFQYTDMSTRQTYNIHLEDIPELTSNRLNSISSSQCIQLYTNQPVDVPGCTNRNTIAVFFDSNNIFWDNLGSVFTVYRGNPSYENELGVCSTRLTGNYSCTAVEWPNTINNRQFAPYNLRFDWGAQSYFAIHMDTFNEFIDLNYLEFRVDISATQSRTYNLSQDLTNFEPPLNWLDVWTESCLVIGDGERDIEPPLNCTPVYFNENDIESLGSLFWVNDPDHTGDTFEVWNQDTNEIITECRFDQATCTTPLIYP